MTDLATSRSELKSINAIVKHNFPRIDLYRDAWTYFLEGWTFHGPNGFTWHDHKHEATNAYDCRVKGWQAYLKFKGVTDN